MTPMLNVLLAEDPTRAPLRPLLRKIPTVPIVAEATDGRVALPLIAAHQPDVAVVDTALPGLNGFDVAERASREHPRTRVLVVSTEPELGHVAQAVRVGASGYLLKTTADRAERSRSWKSSSAASRVMRCRGHSPSFRRGNTRSSS